MKYIKSFYESYQKAWLETEHDEEMYNRGYNDFKNNERHISSEKDYKQKYTLAQINSYEKGWQDAITEENIP